MSYSVADPEWEIEDMIVTVDSDDDKTSYTITVKAASGERITPEVFLAAVDAWLCEVNFERTPMDTDESLH